MRDRAELCDVFSSKIARARPRLTARFGPAVATLIGMGRWVPKNDPERNINDQE